MDHNSAEFWTPDVARTEQIPQDRIGVSSCGIAAHLVALKIQGVDVDRPEVKKLSFPKRYCDCIPHWYIPTCPVNVFDYLVTRSNSGSMKVPYAGGYVPDPDRISQLEDIFGIRLSVLYKSGARVKFGGFNQEVTALMKLGYVPIVTANMQLSKKYDDDEPDYWHTFAIIKTTDTHVWVTNPVKEMSISKLVDHITTPRELKISVALVRHHIPDTMTDDQILSYNWSDEKWNEYKVSKQIVAAKHRKVSHVTIPYFDEGGIIFVKVIRD